jgi:hypothetical protein
VNKQLAPLIQQIHRLFERNNVAQQIRESLLANLGPVAIVSDYGGEHKNADYKTYAFLCTYLVAIKAWHNEYIMPLRERCGLRDQTIDYERLRKNDRFQRARVLPEWLALSNRIPGTLVVVSVDKQLDTVFAQSLMELKIGMLATGFNQWSPEVLEKALRVLHILSYLMSLTTHEDQQFLWITDRDPIANNEEQKRGLLKLWERIYPLYVKHRLQKIGVLIPEQNDPFVKDVVSIPDLAAGAVTALLTALKNKSSNALKEEAREIYNFLRGNTGKLRKILVNIPAELIEGEMGIGGELYGISISS